jgi:hypothetical protein
MLAPEATGRWCRVAHEKNPYKVFSKKDLTSKKSGNLSLFRDMRKKIPVRESWVIWILKIRDIRAPAG